MSNQSATAADPSPWQTGTPPGRGRYLVTQRFGPGDGSGSLATSVFIMEWDGEDWLEYSSVEGALYSIKDADPVLAWMPLPEPYRD